jgi:hypothetical protein
VPRLKLTRPLDPWTQQRPQPAPCPRGERLRTLLAGLPANVVSLRPEARATEIEIGMAYCVRKCGGCELTKGWAPE